ncbi:hypothetical protein [Georgenia sp. AZ-5]|uniref:hypothetical protein n=1 Tax=Georgenia sp. AZ-5 TaxID=3367526 RepID=UPI00375491AE
MTRLSLSLAPDGITNPSVWVNGEPGEAAVGDLWLLSWNGEGLGLVVISARLADFVLTWPATLPRDNGHAPAVRVDESPLGVPVDVWPTRETGISKALLHRRLGHLLPPRLMGSIGDALDEGNEPPVPFAPPAADIEGQRIRDEAMIDYWEEICLIQWPALVPATPRLSPDLAREAQLTPSQVAELFGIEAADAVALIRGEVDLTPDQAQEIAQYFDRPVGELAVMPQDPAAVALLNPVWKEDIVQLAQRRDVDEATARNLVVDEFALAARSSNAVEDRLRAVFARLMNE